MAITDAQLRPIDIFALVNLHAFGESLNCGSEDDQRQTLIPGMWKLPSRGLASALGLERHRLRACLERLESARYLIRYEGVIQLLAPVAEHLAYARLAEVVAA